MLALLHGTPPTVWAALAVPYLLGSIPFGYLVVKFGEGRDIRASGSGNIGAANVARSAGPVLGALTLLLDAAKGWLSVGAVAWLANGDITVTSAAALVVVAGHMFPVWLKFRGGKGVATGVGAFVYMCWPAVAGAFVVWVAGLLVSRYVSLGSVLSAAALPPLIYFLYEPAPAPRALSVAASVAAVLIIWKHRDNIARMVAGTENRFKFKR